MISCFHIWSQEPAHENQWETIGIDGLEKFFVTTLMEFFTFWISFFNVVNQDRNIGASTDLFFDVIAGTSLGGLTAAALSMPDLSSCETLNGFDSCEPLYYAPNVTAIAKDMALLSEEEERLSVAWACVLILLTAIVGVGLFYLVNK